jgi:GT2 family glycosyltransferase
MTDPTPLVSIVIPTRNRRDALVRCLDGIRDLSSPAGDFEVVIVDDGSDHPLDDAVRPFQDRLQVRLVRQQNAGPATARNAGARHAAGAVLAFTDDDCVPDPDWLTELLRCQEQDPDAIVGGDTVNAVTGNLCSQASQDLVSYLYDYYQSKQGHPAFFTSNNMMVRRDTFLAMGGFDTSFRLAAGEDRELCDRWLAAGYPLRNAPRAIIRHHHRLSFRRYVRQHFNYGRGAYHFHVKRRHRAQRETEPPSFYRDLVLYPLRCRRARLAGVALGALAGVSQVANAAGYFYEKWLGDRTLPAGAR